MDNTENKLDKINEEQKEFLSALLAWRPDFKKYCTTERDKDGGYNLRIEIPSPTGEQERGIFIWVDNGDISIEFGLWHTHVSLLLETEEKGYYREYSILDVVKMIVANEIVYFTETGGETPYSGILNLNNKNEIAELLTGPYSTGEIEVRSWDGTQDKKATLKNLTL